jgi:hypothetical protein
MQLWEKAEITSRLRVEAGPSTRESIGKADAFAWSG